MRYKHQLIDKTDLLKEIDTGLNNYRNSYIDKNSVLWVRNIICKAETKEAKNYNNICGVEDVIYKNGNKEYTIGQCSHCKSLYAIRIPRTIQLYQTTTIISNFSYCPFCGYKLNVVRWQSQSIQVKGGIL